MTWVKVPPPPRTIQEIFIPYMIRVNSIPSNIYTLNLNNTLSGSTE